MSDIILTAVGIACMFGFLSVLAHRIGPGLSEAMSAWAERTKDQTTHSRVEQWAEGFQEGQQFERDKLGGRE